MIRFLTSVRRSIRRTLPSTGPWAWYVQAGCAAVVVLVLFGMQSNAPWSSPDGPEQGRHVVDAKAISSVGADGEELYNTRCVSCHQMNGQGVPGTFPPLNESEWVTGDKGRLIRILLDGIQGRIRVKGTTYTGVMPPWRGALSDEQVAQISTYVRTNFGNDASEVSADEVAKVREATTDRSSPWTADELEEEANQGIPGDSTASE